MFKSTGFRPLMMAAVVALTLPLATPVWAQEDAALAIVNGDKILKKDVLEALDVLKVKKEDTAEVLPQVLGQIINEKLVDEAVNKSGVAESADFKKRIEVLNIQLQRQMYLENYMKDKIGDKAVAAEYNKFVKQNKGKTEVNARHILVPSEQEAIQAIKDLDAGADFADLARKRSSGPSAQTGGELGFFLQDEMVPEFSKAAFALKPGTYTKKPVKSQFGWHVIKSEAKRERKVPALKEVENPIRQKLGNDAMQKLIADLRAKASIQEFDLNGQPVKATEKKAEKK